MLRMARRPDEREAEMLSEENLVELRRNLAHLSPPAVRDFYEQAYPDCRLIADRLRTPKQVQNAGPPRETVETAPARKEASYDA